MDLSKKTFNIRAHTPATKNLKLKFTNVDTEELKNIEIICNGNDA
jgi:hypothetical protein